MQEESTTKSLIAQEAEEHKDLWEKEVVSRSKLGLKVGEGSQTTEADFLHIVLVPSGVVSATSYFSICCSAYF